MRTRQLINKRFNLEKHQATAIEMSRLDIFELNDIRGHRQDLGHNRTPFPWRDFDSFASSIDGSFDGKYLLRISHLQHGGDNCKQCPPHANTAHTIIFREEAGAEAATISF